MLRKYKLQMARFDLVSLYSSAALALPQGKEVFVQLRWSLPLKLTFVAVIAALCEAPHLLEWQQWRSAGPYKW